MAKSKSGDYSTVPRSMRHKQILDAAADQPDASMEAIASDVPSATTELVERVLEEYGDPADGHHDALTEAGDSSATQERVYPGPDDLSAKQRETLRAIHEHPEASQRELADVLDVSGSTVSNRVNAIEGFDWNDRRAFSEAVFGPRPITEAEDSAQMAANDTQFETTIDQLADRVTAIERQVTDLAEADESRSAFTDPDLAHKVVHACLNSDAIAEEEELRILKALLR